MRTELRPLDVAVRPGELTIIEIEIGNTADVIDGVTARIEGGAVIVSLAPRPGAAPTPAK